MLGFSKNSKCSKNLMQTIVIGSYWEPWVSMHEDGAYDLLFTWKYDFHDAVGYGQLNGSRDHGSMGHITYYFPENMIFMM